MKKHIAAALVVICVSASIVPNLHAFSGTYNLENLLPMLNFSLETDYYDAQAELYEIQIEDGENQLEGFEEENPLGMGQLDELKTRSKLVPMKLAETKALAEYELQTRYYSVFLLTKQNELLNAQLELLTAQIRVENTKLTYGDSTQSDVDALMVREIAVRRAVEANAEAAEAIKGIITEKTATSAADINTTLEITSAELAYIPQLDYLQQQLVNENASAVEYRLTVRNKRRLIGYIDDSPARTDAMADSAEAEYNLAVAQEELYCAGLRQSAVDVYVRYLSAKAAYSPETYALMANRLAAAQSAYQHGEISELELLSQQASIREQLYTYYENAAAFRNAITELQMAEQGVLVGGVS
ncbi:MAG: hypothetical protein LBD85_05925 [Oscillospiraceae bacterium]|jgi:hypothetical protein|nr:hypothetical protein [Oscillospiraceae bacterium]